MRLTNRNEKITISIVGSGNRSTAYINAMEKHFKNQFEIVAIFDPSEERKDFYRKKYAVKAENIYNSYEDFIKLPRLSDIVIIGTLDDMHYLPTIHAIKSGYDLILEKPISKNLEETVKIGYLGSQYPDQLIAVCHVLRHSPFFVKIKEIIDSKVLGEVIDIQHNENVGYYHFAHSYVRGSWRNTDLAAPFIVAKSCHDMDILLYLLGDKHCERLSSFGALKFFNHAHYDKDHMAPRCSECKIEKTCPYSALQIYSSGKMKSVVFDSSSEEKLIAELKDSIYGRCVFNCDNNVIDHQVTALEFENGVHATFNLSAFSNEIHRSIKIMCEYGEIRGLETTKVVEVTKFGSKEKTIYHTQKFDGGHGGADDGFVINFFESYKNNKPFDSTLAKSIESHVMAFGADKSRLNQGEVIDIKNFHREVLKNSGKEDLL